jgi:hypothetical protein
MLVSPRANSGGTLVQNLGKNYGWICYTGARVSTWYNSKTCPNNVAIVRYICYRAQRQQATAQWSAMRDLLVVLHRVNFGIKVINTSNLSDMFEDMERLAAAAGLLLFISCNTCLFNIAQKRKV